MIEPEMAYTTHEESLDIQEAYVKHLIKSVLKNQQYPLDVLERDTALLEKYVSSHSNVLLTMMRLSYYKRRSKQ